MSAFETRLSDGVFTIFCPQTVEATHTPVIETFSKQCLEEQLKLVLLDMAKTLDIAPQAYRGFVALHQAMKKSGTPMASIHVLPKLAYRLVGDGMSEVFTICPNPEDAYLLAGLNPDGTAVGLTRFGGHLRSVLYGVHNGKEQYQETYPTDSTEFYG